jgi:hypothetical protein
MKHWLGYSNTVQNAEQNCTHKLLAHYTLNYKTSQNLHIISIAPKHSFFSRKLFVHADPAFIISRLSSKERSVSDRIMCLSAFTMHEKERRERKLQM